MFGPDDPEARQGRRLMVTREGVLMHALYECDEGEMNYTLPCPKVLSHASPTHVWAEFTVML